LRQDLSLGASRRRRHACPLRGREGRDGPPGAAPVGVPAPPGRPRGSRGLREEDEGMPRKRTTPKLLRSAGRTAGRAALVSGTATAVAGRVAHRQQRKLGGVGAAEPAAAAAPAAAPAGDVVASLRELAALRDAGALTDRECSAAKAKVVSSWAFLRGVRSAEEAEVADREPVYVSTGRLPPAASVRAAIAEAHALYRSDSSGENSQVYPA